MGYRSPTSLVTSSTQDVTPPPANSCPMPPHHTEGKTAQYGEKAMTAWTMFSWRRLYNGRLTEANEQYRMDLPADTRQLVYNVYVYFSRKPGRSAKTALTKTARATMLPIDIVAEIIRDKHRD